eukprot:s4534_g2.t1
MPLVEFFAREADMPKIQAAELCHFLQERSILKSKLEPGKPSGTKGWWMSTVESTVESAVEDGISST